MALLVIYLLQIKKTLSGVYLQKRVISQNQLAAGQWIRPSCPEGSNLTSKSSWWKVDWGNKWGTVSCFLLKCCVLVRGANDKWPWGSSLVQPLCSRLPSLLFSCSYYPDFIAFSGWTPFSESGAVRRGIEDSSCFPDTIYHNTSLNFSFLKQTWKKKARGERKPCGGRSSRHRCPFHLFQQFKYSMQNARGAAAALHLTRTRWWWQQGRPPHFPKRWSGAVHGSPALASVDCAD